MVLPTMAALKFAEKRTLQSLFLAQLYSNKGLAEPLPEVLNQHQVAAGVVHLRVVSAVFLRA